MPSSLSPILKPVIEEFIQETEGFCFKKVRDGVGCSRVQPASGFPHIFVFADLKCCVVALILLQ